MATNLCKKFSSGSVVEKKGTLEEALCLKRFNKTRQGKAFSIQRPSFKAGEVETYKYVPKLKPNDRDGMGNHRIVRNSFIAPEIKGREALNFERLQAQDIEMGGIKVQLGDKTIEKLFKIQIADPTDVEWIEEKNNRLASGESLENILADPPFGRPQRKISKMVNFGAQGLSVDNKIESIKAAVEQGGADSRTQMANVIASTAEILGNINNLRNISQTGFNNLKQAFNRMSIPKNYKGMGFEHRLFTLEQYREQAGLINLFLLSNLGEVPNDRTLEKPLVSYNEDGNVVGRASIIQLVNSLQSEIRSGMRRPSKYLDLKHRAIIPLNAAVNLANNGVDDGQLNGQNPPEDEPNNGKWLPDVLPRWDLPKLQQEDNPKGIPIQG